MTKIRTPFRPRTPWIAAEPVSPEVAATMAFVVMSLGTIGSGLVLRRATTSGLSGPVLDAVGVLTIPVVLTVFAVELPFLQRLLDTVSLTQGQWLVSIALALVLPVVVELGKLSKTAS